jgi:hypothetical protein
MVTQAGTTMGSGASSSISQNAWLVKGAPNSNTVTSVNGVFGFGVRDIAETMTATPSDSIQYGLARLHDPSDNSSYEVRFTNVNRTAADVKFGGVGLLKPVFGNTGIGEATLPKTFAYIVAWGMADIYKNGQRIASSVPAHMLVTPGLRDPATGALLAQENIDLNARQLILHVPGPVTGLPDGKLLAHWPSASLDLNDIGGRPMNQQAIASAIVTGMPNGRVLGEAVEVEPQRIQFSLRNNDILSYVPPTFTTGYTRVTVVNNSSRSRGAIIRARDVIGSQIVRYTPVLRPGQSYSFFTHFGPGSFNVMDYHGAAARGMQHWRSSYQTSFEISR